MPLGALAVLLLFVRLFILGPWSQTSQERRSGKRQNINKDGYFGCMDRQFRFRAGDGMKIRAAFSTTSWERFRRPIRQTGVRGFILVVLLLAAAACGTSGEDGCSNGGACAPRNRQPVPPVEEQALEKACETLQKGGYAGGVRDIVEQSFLPRGTVLDVDPEPGRRGFQGQVLMLEVAGPVDVNHLPGGCVSRISGTY